MSQWQIIVSTLFLRHKQTNFCLHKSSVQHSITLILFSQCSVCHFNCSVCGFSMLLFNIQNYNAVFKLYFFVPTTITFRPGICITSPRSIAAQKLLYIQFLSERILWTIWLIRHTGLLRFNKRSSKMPDQEYLNIRNQVSGKQYCIIFPDAVHYLFSPLSQFTEQSHFPSIFFCSCSSTFLSSSHRFYYSHTYEK